MDEALLGPPAGDLTTVELDGCLSVYSVESASIVTLNETATQVWELCDGTRTLDDVVDALAAAYGMAPEDVRTDVEATVTGLVEQGLLPVRRNDPGQAPSG